MLAYRRHRTLTRWPRHLAFAFLALLVLAAGYRFYRAWQQAHPAPLTAPVQAA